MLEPCVHEGPRILLDMQLAVVEMNPAARRLLGRNTRTLVVHQRRLTAPADPHGLTRSLTKAARGGRIAMSLPRPEMQAMTLSAELLPLAGGHQVLVSLRDPELERPDPVLLQGLFGLTPTEAQVAAAIALGLDSLELARGMGVQLNTVQAHIKRVLLKSGARRQSQLVSLILRSVAMRSPPFLAEAALGDESGLTQTGNDGTAASVHSRSLLRSPAKSHRP